ncbi:MAG: CBS domain-containing protein [Candidatus Diapherotrites archaeon]|nr:CBS domain-containing protein [Candidatus Diapherotrites archaeon]
MLFSGDDLRRLRKRLGFTQAKVARLAGVSQSLVARIEQGSVDPRASTLSRISGVLSPQNLCVRSVMSSPVIYVTAGESVSSAISKMQRYNISQMPVMDGCVQVGSVVDSSLLKRLSPSLVSASVSSVMGKPFPSVSASDSVGVLPALLRKHNAVVVVEDGLVAGIVSKQDVLRLFT